MEESIDRFIALVVLVIMLILGVFCGKAMACNSFESCMEEKDAYTPHETWPPGGISATIEITPLWASNKAIAYKLEEISKKLDKPNDEYIPMGPVLWKKPQETK